MIRLRKILFPTDFSACADRAFDLALMLAQQFGADLRMFHAVVLHDEDPHNPAHHFPDPEAIHKRLEALADPGGICLSGDACRQVRGKIDEQFEDLGKREVKNIREPVRVWRWAGAPAALPMIELAAFAGVAPPRQDKPGIAVLPFDNMSGDAEQEYFADGMAEDIIVALSRFRWLFVIARNSSFTFKGQAVDVKQVGRELGVRYILDGSVRRAGKRIRVAVQLIDAATGTQIWARNFDRVLEDIFALQDEIANSIVAEIEPELGQAEQRRAYQEKPENLDAWDVYQRGTWHLYQRTVEDLVEAQRLFEEVIRLEPEAPLGYASAALAYWAEAEMLVFSKFDFQLVSATRINAAIHGSRVTRLENHIKAVTYHNLEIIETESGLTATVVFDV